MILSGIENESIEISISRYQYPEIITPEDYDSNYLFIYLKVKSKQGDWQTVDPALLTWEVQTIIDWFTALFNNSDNVLSTVEFIEPNLSFHLIKNDPSVKAIRISFDLEFKPRFANDDTDCFVDCELTNDELKHAASILSNELCKYPVR